MNEIIAMIPRSRFITGRWYSAQYLTIVWRIRRVDRANIVFGIPTVRSNNNRAPPQHAGCGNNCRGSDIWPTIFALTTMSSDCTNLSLNPSTALFTLPRRPRWMDGCVRAPRTTAYTYICECARVYVPLIGKNCVY